MIRRAAILALAVVLPLAACSTNVNWRAAADLAEQDAELVPQVSPAVAVKTFDTYCYSNTSDPGSVIADLKSDGYVLLVTNKRERMFGYAHPTRPMVAVIDDAREPACMTFVRRDPNLAAAFDRYILREHPGAMSIRVEDIEYVRMVPGDRELTFVRDFDDDDEVLMLIVERTGG